MGGYIISGHHTPSSGSDKLTLVKLNSTGVVQWGKYIAGSEYGFSVHQTSDGGFIFCSNTLLVKTNSSGVQQWAKSFSVASFKQLRQTTDGGFALTGCTTNGDVCLLKTDSSGALTWSKTFGGTSLDIGNSLQQTSDGGYIIAGTTQSYGAGAEDVYLIKTATDGTLQWTRTFGGTLGDEGNSVKQTNEGGYVVTGSTESFGIGNNDVYLIKINMNGELQWSKTFGGTSDESGFGVEKANNDGFVIAGYTTSSFATYGTDIYLIKTDSNGNSASCYETSPISVQDSGGVTSTATITVTVSTDTTSNLFAGASFGSSANTICTTVDIQKTEVKDGISIFPNPAQNNLQIKFNTAQQVKEIKIFDILGNEINPPLNPLHVEGLINVDVSSLQNGIYFIEVKTAEGILSKKIIVQH